MSGLGIEASDFKLEKLPAHLHLLVRIRDEEGRIIGQSRDPDDLVGRFAERARREFMVRQAERWQQDGLTIDQLEPLPEVITTRGGHQAWPALVEQGRRAGIRLFDDRTEAVAAHRAGLAALLRSALANKLKYLRKNNGLSRPAQLAWTRIEDIADLTDALRELCLNDFLDSAWETRDREAFERLHGQVRQDLIARYKSLAGTLDQCLQQWHHVQRQLNSLEQPLPKAVADMRSQIEDLMYAGFLRDIDAGRLQHYPRYLTGMEQRMLAMELDPIKDCQRQDKVLPWWQRYLEHLAAGGWYTPALDDYRWLVEEYRVQQFAQQLGTACKVSAARLADAWARVKA